MADLPEVKEKAPQIPVSFDGEIYKSVGKYARSAVLYAFEQMGGANGLAQWGEENKDEFYTKLFPKIIARESEVTHHKTVDQLMDVIDGEYEVEEDFDATDDLPSTWGQGQAIPQVSHNWNASDFDFDNETILSVAAGEEEFDPLDLVEFEE